MAETLVTQIRLAAKAEKGPPGGEFLALSLEDTAAIASRAGVSRKEVEIAALETGVIPRRYHRNMGAIGIEGQLKLRRAKVAVAGAGGLGGTIIELLARLGVGALSIIDSQTFTEDNLNRQLLCTEGSVGRSKAEAAAARVALINSAVDVEAHWLTLDRGNCDGLLRGCSLAMDALDSIPVRLLLQESAGRLGIPFIHGAIAGFVGELMTVIPGERGLRYLFGDGRDAPQRGVESEAGTPTVTPAAIAALQVMEAVKVLLGRGAPAREMLLYCDLDRGEVTSLRFREGEVLNPKSQIPNPNRDSTKD